MIFARAILIGVIVAAAGHSKTAIADAGASWRLAEDSLATDIRAEEKHTKEVLASSNIVSDFTGLINKHFKSSPDRKLEDIKVILGSGRNPYVNIDANEIFLPYGYLTYAIKSHAELEESGEAALSLSLIHISEPTRPY